MLLGLSLVFGMLIVWLAVTALWIILMIYRSFLSLREEDALFIDPGEERLLRDQKALIEKIDRLRPLLIGSLIASIVLGLATMGAVVYDKLF